MNEEIKQICSSLNKTTEKYKQQLNELITCLYEIKAKNEVTDRHLSILEDGIRQPWDVVWFHYSGKYVAELSHNNKFAEDLLIRLSRDSKSRVRTNVLIILTAQPSEYVIKSVISNCIYDKSKNVQLTVANVIERIGGNENIEMLKQTCQTEMNEEVKEHFNNTISLLSVGYYTKKCDDEYAFLYRRLKHGLQIDRVKYSEIESEVKKVRIVFWTI